MPSRARRQPRPRRRTARGATPLQATYGRSADALMNGPDSAIAVAAIAPLLMLLFFLFRVLPWTRTGPWRLVLVLVSLASVMFMFGEVALLAKSGIDGLDPTHQLPLFLAVLAAAAASVVAYFEGARSAERARLLALTDE